VKKIPGVEERSPVGWIARGVLIELIRRKDVYVLGLLMMVFSMGALLVRFSGTLKPATGTFLLNLGLSLAHLFAHALTLLLAVRQIPSEMENRTLYPILARPVTRGEVIFGKWLACVGSGFLAYGLFFLMVWGTVPRLEAYSASLLGQTVVLQGTSLALTAAWAVLLSFWVPRGVALLILAGLVLVGNTLAGFVRSVFSGRAPAPVADWLLLYLPDFAKLNVTTRYTDGMSAIPPGMFAGLLVYGAMFTGVGLALSCLIFRRRSL